MLFFAVILDTSSLSNMWSEVQGWWCHAGAVLVVAILSNVHFRHALVVRRVVQGSWCRAGANVHIAIICIVHFGGALLVSRLHNDLSPATPAAKVKVLPQRLAPCSFFGESIAEDTPATLLFALSLSRNDTSSTKHATSLLLLFPVESLLLLV